MALPIPKELAALLDALHDGVANLAKDAAVQQLDHWHNVLAKAAKGDQDAVTLTRASALLRGRGTYRLLVEAA